MPRILLAIAMILALMMSGCKVSGSKANASQANLRVANLAPNLEQPPATGAISLATADATVTGNTAPTTCPTAGCDIPNVAFQTVSAYKSYNSGSNTFFSLLLADKSGTEASSSFSLNANTNYTYILYGTSGNISSMLLADTNASTPAGGSFEIRPVHTAIGSGGLDFYMVPGSCSVATKLTSCISSLSASFTGFVLTGVPAFVQFVAGPYVMVVTTTGTKNIVYQSAPVQFNNGDIATADLYNSGSGSLLNVELMYQDNSAGSSATSRTTTTPVANVFSQFKAVNASPSAGPINVYADNTLISPLFANVPYAAVSSYSAPLTPTASGNITFAPTSGSTLASTSETGIQGASNASLTPPIPPQGGADYSVLLVEQPSRRLVVLPDNNLPPPTGNVKIRFVNAVNTASAIDVQANFAPITGATALAVDTASPTYTTYASGKFPATITANLTGQAGVVATLSGVDTILAVGGTYTVYFVGNVGSIQAFLTRDQ